MQVFTIAPANIRPLWIALPLVAVALAFVAVVVSLVGVRTARFEVTPAGLRLRGGLYGRFIPSSVLVTSRAQRVDLADQNLRPIIRTFGTGLPGYRAGWFRLANGEKALLYLTDRRNAVYVSTTDGYSILLSPGDPDAFLTAIRSLP
jgi:hypothetical protein